MNEKFYEVDADMYQDAQPISIGQRAAGGAEKGFQYGSSLGPLGATVGAGAGALYGALNPQSQLKPSNVAKSAAQIGTEAVKAPFYATEIPARVIGYATGRTPKSKFLSEHIQDLKNKYLGEYNPESIIDKGFHYTAANWPLLFLSGTPTAGKLGADLIGSMGMAAAEKISDNPLVAILGDVLARRGLNKGVSALKHVFTGEAKAAGKAYPKIEAHKAAMYKKSEDLGSRLSSNPIKPELGDTLGSIKTKVLEEPVTEFFDKAAKKRTLAHISEMEELLGRQTLPLQDLANKEKVLNKHLSKTIKQNKPFSIESQYFSDIKNSITDALEGLSNSPDKQYKEFAKYYKNAKELHRSTKWQSNLGKWAEKSADEGVLNKVLTNKIARGIVSGLVGYKMGTPTGLALYGLTPAFRKAGQVGAKSTQEAQRLAKFAQNLMVTTEGANLLKDIIVDSYRDNISGITKSMRKLNKYADEFDLESNEKFFEVNADDYQDLI